MKKFKLEISKPCHQDWNTMTAEERGRFCKSCQKTVVDFTGMSDRQLAEFFRKPKGEVCGRLHNDQLERAIAIPKKRIPWFRYFFQFTWPAFVFFLKSCGHKESTVGKVKLDTQSHITFKDDHDSSVILDSKPVTLGNLNFEYVANTDTEFHDLLLQQIQPEKKVKKEFEILSSSYKGCPTVNQADSSLPFPETVLDTARMDTVWLETSTHIRMGALSITRCTSSVSDEVLQKETSRIEEKKVSGFLIYPNPVRQGNLLTISCGHSEQVPDLVQIYSSGGQLVNSLEQKPSEASLVFNIRIPSQVTSGVYFLRMINKKKNQQHTEKIAVE